MTIFIVKEAFRKGFIEKLKEKKDYYIDLADKRYSDKEGNVSADIVYNEWSTIIDTISMVEAVFNECFSQKNSVEISDQELFYLKKLLRDRKCSHYFRFNKEAQSLLKKISEVSK